MFWNMVNFGVSLLMFGYGFAYLPPIWRRYENYVLTFIPEDLIKHYKTIVFVVGVVLAVYVLMAWLDAFLHNQKNNTFVFLWEFIKNVFTGGF